VIAWLRTSCLLAALLASSCETPTPDEREGEAPLAMRFDLESSQAPATTHAEIDAVLASLPSVRYRDLPRAYLERTGSNRKPFTRRLRNAHYLLVSGSDRFRFLVGNHRIADFMAHDADYLAHAEDYHHTDARPLLLDPRVPHKILDLQRALTKLGHDANAFSIREAYRHPQLNEEDGGVSRSRHVYGEAVDLVIGDIDLDGDTDDADKAIVIDVLDREIIGDKGGIGRYPGYQTVHFDLRGRRARWDTY
jgi:uncharacterized protein YcbK (DUF882 family)